MAATLSSVLGSMLSSVANARSLSDAQTLRLVANYQADNLMRHFPVPRIEVKEIVFEVKFAVTEVTETDTLIETSTAALQDYRPETLTQVRLVANVQNYALHTIGTDTQLIPTQ